MIKIPTSFKPTHASHFVGPAGRLAHLLAHKFRRIEGNKEASYSAILHGPPGTGKSSVCLAAAAWLTNHTCMVEQLNGQSTTIDVVRQWRDNFCYIQTGWKVVVIDEVCKSSLAAVAEMLTLIDTKPPMVAFLMTTNRDPEKDMFHGKDTAARIEKARINGDPMPPEELLRMAFQSRVFAHQVDKPNTDEIRAMVWEWIKNDLGADAIANVADGNVRLALIEAEAWLDRKAVGQ